MEELASDSFRSSVSSPGIPKTCLTPSDSRHSTKTSDALRAANPLSSSAQGPRGRTLRNGRSQPSRLAWVCSTDPAAMRRAILLTALGALFCAPSAASAATSFTIPGAGWGHGIGMSQYGAYGQAQQGRNYQQILGHYYRGTAVTMSAQRSIRVLLQASRTPVSFTGATRAGDRTLSAAKT